MSMKRKQKTLISMLKIMIGFLSYTVILTVTGYLLNWEWVLTKYSLVGMLFFNIYTIFSTIYYYYKVVLTFPFNELLLRNDDDMDRSLTNIRIIYANVLYTLNIDNVTDDDLRKVYNIYRNTENVKLPTDLAIYIRIFSNLKRSVDYVDETDGLYAFDGKDEGLWPASVLEQEDFVNRARYVHDI